MKVQSSKEFYIYIYNLHSDFISETSFIPVDPQWHEKLDGKIDDFNSTEYWESSEKAHGAPNETKLCLQGQFPVSLNLIIGCRHKVKLDKVQRS